MWKRHVVLVCLMVILAGCAAANESSQSADTNHPINNGQSSSNHTDEPPIDIVVVPPEQVAGDIIQLLKNKDMLRLAAYINPVDGVRFSPYGHINPEQDIVFSAKELETALTGNETKIWGSYDGSGEPIELTFADYFDRFIYTLDYASAGQISYNEIIGKGNTLNNQKEVYPEAFIVEYYHPGTANNEGMDWSSLRIVLELVDGEWLCSGIIHDQWTI